MSKKVGNKALPQIRQFTEESQKKQKNKKQKEKEKNKQKKWSMRSHLI